MPAPLGWEGRKDQHDTAGVPLVCAVFLEYGFTGYAFGAEAGNASFHRAVQAQTDPTSLLLRFRPDRAFVRTGLRSLLCEIKTEGHDSPNFALELDSWQAARQWNAAYEHVAFVFVDLRCGEAVACWATMIPMPQKVYVPRRFDFIQQRERVAREMPAARLCDCTHRGGSGTPFFLVPKAAAFLRPLRSFLAAVLASAVVPVLPPCAAWPVSPP